MRLASGVTFIIRFLRFGLIFSSSSPFVHKIQAQTHTLHSSCRFFLYFIRRFTNETLPHNTAERYRPTASGTLPHQYQSSFSSTQLKISHRVWRVAITFFFFFFLSPRSANTHTPDSVFLFFHFVQFLQRRRARRVFCIIFLLITVLS